MSKYQPSIQGITVDEKTGNVGIGGSQNIEVAYARNWNKVTFRAHDRNVILHGTKNDITVDCWPDPTQINYRQRTVDNQETELTEKIRDLLRENKKHVDAEVLETFFCDAGLYWPVEKITTRIFKGVKDVKFFETGSRGARH